MKIEIKPAIHELLGQLPKGALTPGDIARLNLIRAFLKALRTDSATDDLTTNMFHDGAALALAEGITDALRDIIRAAMPKIDGRRRPAAAAQALNEAQTFQGRIKVMKAVLAAYKQALADAPNCGSAEARGQLMRPAFAPVQKAFESLQAVPAPSDEAQETVNDMSDMHASLGDELEQWATVELAHVTKANGPGASPTLARWITLCSTLATQAAEAIRAMKNPS